MQKLLFNTKRKKQVLDITDDINAQLKSLNRSSGLIHLHILHTTACLTTADLDPGTDLDMLDAFEAIMPKLKFRHPHNPAHVGDHIWSSVIGPGVLIPYDNHQLILGTWQRVVLIELDGPRERSIVMSVLTSE